MVMGNNEVISAMDAKTPKVHLTACSKDHGKLRSTVSKSDEKRFKILPIGVASKNLILAPMIDLSMRL